MAFGYSGDIFQARDRAAKAKDRQDIVYAIPKEGSLLWIDVAAIPKDAPDPDQALSFLDFMMEPKVAAASSELTGYANANTAATALLPSAAACADNRSKLAFKVALAAPPRRGCAPSRAPACRTADRRRTAWARTQTR